MDDLHVLRCPRHREKREGPELHRPTGRTPCMCSPLFSLFLFCRLCFSLSLGFFVSLYLVFSLFVLSVVVFVFLHGVVLCGVSWFLLSSPLGFLTLSRGLLFSPMLSLCVLPCSLRFPPFVVFGFPFGYFVVFGFCVLRSSQVFSFSFFACYHLWGLRSTT